MALASTMVRYLRQNGLSYEVVLASPPAGPVTAPDTVLARAVVVSDTAGLVLLVIPVPREPDWTGIERLLQRSLTPAGRWQVSHAFGDCDPDHLPACGEPYGMRTLVDEALVTGAHAHVAMWGGDAEHLLRFSHSSFLQLHARSWTAPGLSVAAGDTAVPQAGVPAGAERLSQRLQSVEALPPMPGMANEVLRLRADPNAGPVQLAALVERDPSLSAQVMRYAASPFFAYRGRIDGVQTAITRVLGYDMVADLALGVAAARPFKIPSEGPWGLRAFWRHAVYSAALMQVLNQELPRELQLPSGTAYLSGLLHNFGWLMLGHVFEPEYLAVCRAAAEQPDRPLVTVERETLGCDHGWLGGHLLEAWRLPPQVTSAARFHHREDYAGPHAAAAALALICDRALKPHGIGDGDGTHLPPAMLERLQLDELKVLGAISRILQGCAGLDAMARQLAA